MIRLATDKDGPRIGELVQQNGFQVSELDWSEVAPWWLVSVEEQKITGAIQICPGKPTGRLEMLSVDPGLDPMPKARTVKELVEQGSATLAMGGSQIAIGVIPFEMKSYKRLLKRRGTVVISSGNVMAKRL